MTAEAPESVQRPTDPSAAVQAAAASIDVFISYASQDTAVANDVVAALERQGVKCWIAPRNVTPGAFYADEIVHAIDTVKAIVLILSQNAADSQHVLREVERAASKRHPVVSLRIDQAPMPAGLEYFLNTSQWLDASVGDIARSMPKLIAAVRVAIQAPLPRAATPRAPGRSPSARPPKRTAIIVASLLGLMIAGLAIWESSRRATPTSVRTAAVPTPAPAAAAPAIPEKSVAVLPFVDMSEKHDQEYFSDGLSEELIDMLTKVRDLRVPARTSSFYFKGKQAKISEIAKELGVAHVLEGSVRKSGNTLRVTAQLIRVDNGYHLWSETYDRKLDDIFKVQDGIAGAVVQALKVSLLESAPVRTRPTESVEAYTLYLHGRFIGDRALWNNQYDAAIKYVQRALDADPQFALAWAWLSRMYSSKRGDRDANLRLREAALHAAKRSLELDPKLAEGRIAMAKITFGFDWDLPNFEAEMNAAHQLEPNNADVLSWMAVVSDVHSQLEEAVAWSQQAIAIDPLNPSEYQSLGRYYLRLGRDSDAETAFRKSLELNPQNLVLHWDIAESLFLRGKYARADDELKLEQEEGRDLGYVFLDYAMGRTAESDAGMLATEKKYGRTTTWPAAYYLACAHAYRGERDQAFKWLDLSFQRRETMGMKGDPLLKNLESDPRYKELLRKMKLPG